MPKIKVSINRAPVDGEPLRFRAPCDCSTIDGLVVYYPILSGNAVSSTSRSFTLKDAHGQSVDGIDDLFKKDAVLQVLLDVTNSTAFILNADTNGYIEGKLDEAITSMVAGPGVSVTVKDGVATIGANYQYSQTDLAAGSSSLEEGRLYFVYE